MEIVKPNTAHEFNVRSRDFTSEELIAVVFNKRTQVYSTYPIVGAVKTEGGIIFTLDIEAEAEVNYKVTLIQNNSRELTKFLVFCTEQEDLQNYQITEGEYVMIPQEPNEYITLNEN